MIKKLILSLGIFITLSFGATIIDWVIAYEKGDFKTAFPIFEDLASKGNATAQYVLGIMYENGEGVKQDYIKAKEWYTKSANKGLAEAQYNLGGIYFNGKGVKQDYRQAIYWYKKAANQKHAQAQHNVGVMYANGYGAKQDYKIAKIYFGQACDGGHQLGCDAYKEVNQLGYWYGIDYFKMDYTLYYRY